MLTVVNDLLGGHDAIKTDSLVHGCSMLGQSYAELWDFLVHRDQGR